MSSLTGMKVFFYAIDIPTGAVCYKCCQSVFQAASVMAAVEKRSVDPTYLLYFSGFFTPTQESTHMYLHTTVTHIQQQCSTHAHPNVHCVTV